MTALEQTISTTVNKAVQKEFEEQVQPKLEEAIATAREAKRIADKAAAAVGGPRSSSGGTGGNNDDVASNATSTKRRAEPDLGPIRQRKQMVIGGLADYTPKGEAEAAAKNLLGKYQVWPMVKKTYAFPAGATCMVFWRDGEQMFDFLDHCRSLKEE